MPVTEPPTRTCPVCGTPTVGIHIAGTVYDFTCEPCADETDANFQTFVTRLADELESRP